MDICPDHVRQHDPDRYLCAMFAPEPARRGLMALYAFNAELTLVRERVSEELLGEMRYQWWREQIEAAYGGSVRPEGYAGALYDFIARHDPPQALFTQLINARSQDLSQDLFEDMPALEAYCRGTNVPLVRLSLCPFGNLTSIEPLEDTVLEDMGVSWALTSLIRDIPAHAARGRCLVPGRVLEEYGTTREALYTEAAKPQLKRIVEYLVDEADQRHASARQRAHAMDRDLFPALLPIALTGFYLSAIRKSSFDPFHPRVMVPNRAARALRLIYAAWRKRV